MTDDNGECQPSRADISLCQPRVADTPPPPEFEYVIARRRVTGCGGQSPTAATLYPRPSPFRAATRGLPLRTPLSNTSLPVFSNSTG